MRDPASNLVRKLWQYCNVLRDDGLSYPDYVEQLTYLLFLKMSDEQTDGPVPAKYGWKSLIALETEKMHRHYGEILAALGHRDGTLGLIFRNAKNKVRDPAKLRLLIVDLIGQTEWSGLSADLKGDAYEGLLEKNARDTKSGAGQYFTPRPLIDAIVRCVDPRPGEVVCDPACGTAGFLLAAHDYLSLKNPNLKPKQRIHLRTKAIRGVELVEEVVRLATMNLLLHGISGQADDELPISCTDSLKSPPSAQVDVVLTNPPFGVKGSVTYSGTVLNAARFTDELTIVRPDFWVQTANKQLNFLQHITALLKPGGRAAVVIPDNVLFEAGAAAAIRRRLLETCEVHTLLRLPTGLFYAAGVKANVLFFDKHPPTATAKIWVYDLRSDNRFSLKAKPLRSDDLADFVERYRPVDRSSRQIDARDARWQTFDRHSILAGEDARMDFTWTEPASQPTRSSLSRLDELSNLIAEDLERALSHIRRTGPQK
jgi:type I restriction enzyme M protein